MTHQLIEPGQLAWKVVMLHLFAVGDVDGGEGDGVVVLQNGVEHAERVAPFVGDAPVLPAVVNIAAEAVSPGHIRHHAYARLEVPDVALGRSFATLFEDSEVTVGLVEDFTSTVWRKLIANVTASPITALTQRRIDVMAF